MEIKKIKLRMLVTAAVVLIAFASACQPQSLTGTNSETMPTSTPAAQPTATETQAEPVSVALPSSLVGKEWTLIAYGDALNPVVVEPALTLQPSSALMGHLAVMAAAITSAVALRPMVRASALVRLLQP
jgi:hypothetical protein